MAISFGRTLYNLSARRRSEALAEGEVESIRPARPAGRLIWLHTPDLHPASAMPQLALRLMAELGVNVLLTCPKFLQVALPGIIEQAPPPDTAAKASAFLTYWQPDLAIMAEGELRPALLLEAADRRVPMLMVDARAPYLLKAHNGWFPGLMRSSLQTFRKVLTVDDAAAKACRRAGAVDVDVVGRMEEASAALGYHEPERAFLAALMATRPVWLAADVPVAEEAAVIAAHRAALRLAHRLLLILVPQDPDRAPILAQQMEASEGWTVAQRSLEQEPDPETEVYIPEAGAEYGLWYRLAPVTFMGGSLLGDGCVRSPMEPAALGSAILYGVKSGEFGPVFGRLGAALAARAVGSVGDLGDALSDLLSPDRAARLAHAAWRVASDGVEVTDRVITLANRILQGDA